MNIDRIQTGEISLYIEGNYVRPEMRGGFMNETVYTAVLDHTIIVCTDAVIINRDRRIFYLVKRAIKPMQGIWWIGGRRKKGETPLKGMCRNFKRETGLDLPDERFTFVTMTEYLWQNREQEPQRNGSHNLCHHFSVELTDAELVAARHGLEKKEYEADYGLREFDRDRLVKEDVHPVIVDVYDKIFST